MAISWTKYWAGSDDGTIVGGIDLKNIQDDLANVTVTGDPLTISGQTQGDVLYFNGTAWVRLPAGTAGQVLTSQGAAANPTFDDANATDLTITGQTTGDLLFFDGANWARLAPGTAGQPLTSNGAGAAPSYQGGSGGVAGSEVFTADGSFTAPAGITTVYLSMVGGGGGSGAMYGGGGGGGAWCLMYPVTVSPASVYTIQVGLGGSGAGTGTGNGSPGEDTIFDVGGTPITMDGGAGGTGNTGTGGAGGIGTIVDDTSYDASGATGGGGYIHSGGAGANPPGGDFGGGGGGTHFGSGATAGSGDTGNPGTDGTGSGASGGSSANRAGADGGDGLVIVMY